jgi:hypothetical protein
MSTRVRDCHGAGEIHGKSQVVMFVDPALAVAVGGGNVLSETPPLPFGVLSRHRRDVARTCDVRYRGGVAAGVQLGVSGHGEEFVHDEPAFARG